MKTTILGLCATVLLCAPAARSQNPEPKFIADTLVVQAEGTFESDPDLATLTFDIYSQKKEDVSSGALTVTPIYGGDRKKRTRSFIVRGLVVLRVREFSKLGPILDESVADEITDLRSLTYSLADEEAAKERAVAQAMKRAIGRANAALGEKGQQVGALRFANLDVRQLVGVARLEMGALSQTVEVSGWSKAKAAPLPPPPPLPRPEKITVSATVQCAFQIR